MSQRSVPASSTGHVREAVHLGDGEALAVEAPDRDAAALRAEVDGGHASPSAVDLSVVAARRAGGRAAGRGGGSRGPGSAVIDLDARPRATLDLVRRARWSR